MTSYEKQDIEQDIEIAELMVKDLERLYNSYSKKALVAKQERELKQDKKGFLDYNNINELADDYGYGMIDEETYRKGIEYFEKLKLPPKLSAIETHRKNIKNLINHWKGTIIELNQELNPIETRIQENIFEKMARLEREERYKKHSVIINYEVR